MSNKILLSLSQSDYQSLLDLLSNDIQFNFLRKDVVNGLHGRKHLEISHEQNEALVDELSNLFTEKGLKSDHEPNDLGYLIESLIDTIGRHLYE